MLKKIKNKKLLLAVFLVMLLVLVLIPIERVSATNMDIMGAAKSVGISIINFIVQTLISLVGKVLILLVKLLVMLSLYNNFIYNSYVQKGWVIIRDIVNMFFILGLLLIAFATVLKIEKYSYNKLLGRLLIMAILVNFSRTIAGLIIDFFQVIMITFVKSFKDITQGNLINGFGSADLFKYNYDVQAGTSHADIDSMVGSIFGLIFVIIATIVVAIFCVILAFRIVALWILIVFSPLAFFSWVFEPAGGKIASLSQQWWGEFFKYCMVGPFLAFFLWIAIISMNGVSQNITQDAVSGGFKQSEITNNVNGLNSPAGTAEGAVGFMMGIIMLVGGLYFTGRMGVVGSGYATGGFNAIRNQTAGRLERGARRAGAAAQGIAMAPVRAAGAPVRGAMQAVGDYARRNKYLRYATAEGRKEAAERVSATARSRFGPRKMAVERVRQQWEEKDTKRLNSEGAFLNPNVWRKRLGAANKKGDLREARALMSQGAKNGWIDTKDVGDFTKKFSRTMGDRPFFEFTEQLGRDYKNETGRHMRTNNLYVTEEGLIKPKTTTPAEEYKDSVRRMKISEQSQMAEQSKFARRKLDPETGEDRNEFWKDELMAYGEETENYGRYNPGARRNIASAIEEVASNPDSMAQFSDSERKQLNKMYEAATAEYQSNGERRKDDTAPTGVSQGHLILGDEYLPTGMKANDYAQGPRGGAGQPPTVPPAPAAGPAPEAPPVPAGGRLSRLAERAIGKERMDSILALKGRTVDSVSDYATNQYKAGKQFLKAKIINGSRQTVMPSLPKRPQPVPGVMEIDDMNQFMQTESQNKQTLAESNFDKPTGQFRNRGQVIAEIRKALQSRGVSADTAENRARQMVNHRESQLKRSLAAGAVNQEVLEDVGFSDIGVTPEGDQVKISGLPEISQADLATAQQQGAKGEVKQSLQKGLYKVRKAMSAYETKLKRRGAKLNEQLAKEYTARLKRLEDFARTRKDLTAEEVQDLVADMETAMNTMISGAFIEK